MMIERQWEVSHLCHKLACFNPAHLKVEMYVCNMRHRDYCRKADECNYGLMVFWTIEFITDLEDIIQLN